MAYTNVPKPSTLAYTKINTYAPSFDEAAISYDDASYYYDGVNTNAYTNVAKPTSSVYTKISKPT